MTEDNNSVESEDRAEIKRIAAEVAEWSAELNRRLADQ